MARRASVLATAALLAAASGCGVPRSGAVAEIGPCAQVLPIAQTHVAKSARLVSVRAVNRADATRVLTGLGVHPTAAQLRRRAQRIARRRHLRAQTPATTTTTRPASLPRKACLLVYQGHFTPRAPILGAAPGRFLILVIGVRHPRLLGGVVVDRVPRAVARMT